MAKHSSSHAPSSAEHTEHHIVPAEVFLKVLGLLVILTVITVVISRFDFGILNLIVAMVVASIKALIVALFFMHLKYENPVTWIYALFPIVLLAVLIGGVYVDNPLRDKPCHAPIVTGNGSCWDKS